MLKTAFYGATSLLTRATVRRPIGRNIYSADWDICIVLDSARVDALRECWDRDVQSAWSVGSISTEWMAQTFRPEYSEEISDTALVTANPHSSTVFDERSMLTNHDDVDVPFPTPRTVSYSDFAAVHELWRSHADTHNVVPPETMAAGTLEAADSSERVVAHWMQPHEPFIAPDAELLGGSPTEASVWRGAMNGDIEPAAIRDAYRKNLRYAVESVEYLLRRTDATVLVTADHGNAFGEWGVWGHPLLWPQPAVRRVPWTTVEGTNEREHDEMGILSRSTVDDSDRSEQLRALGYL